MMEIEALPAEVVLQQVFLKDIKGRRGRSYVSFRLDHSFPVAARNKIPQVNLIHFMIYF